MKGGGRSHPSVPFLRMWLQRFPPFPGSDPIKHMRLEERSLGKDNNLNLVRFCAAFAVLVSHAFVLSSGQVADEPLRQSLGMSLGDISVDVFFAVSGFLVSRSLVQRESGIEFIWARCLRIYPALLAMMALCLLVVAPIYGELPNREFFTHHGTSHFIYRNITLLFGAELSLPGVFDSVPWKWILNGSLWTMTYELRMYLCLVGLWWLLLPLGVHKAKAFRIACVVVAMAAFGWQFWTLLFSPANELGLFDPVPRLILMFFSGAAWWAVSPYLNLDGRFVLLGFLPTVFLQAIGATSLFHLAYGLWIPYLVWWLAFVPTGRIREFNRLGDSSFGIYIYAFPIQQMWVHSFPQSGPYAMIAGAGTAVILLGFLSWHFLEKRALSLKDLPRRWFPKLSRF